jgi:sucrose-6-phosphate hydrolase SacC (GH32 family)
MPVNFYEVPDFYPLSNGQLTKHVVVVDPWAQFGDGYHVHNVEWHVGDWSEDGAVFTPTGTGLFDYGWWYAARSLSDGANEGRRLMLGNIGADVTQGAATVAAQKAIKIRFFTALPREISLAADGETVHVRPPKELVGLRVRRHALRLFMSLRSVCNVCCVGFC